MKLTAKLFALMLLAVTTLTACNSSSRPLTDEERAARAAERRAERLVRGETAVADCIAARCERLDLDGSRLNDFNVLNDLTHVKALMVSRTNFDDLGDIAGMPQLQELHISNTNVEDLSGIHIFSNLDILHMEALREKPSIEPLSTPALTGLIELALTTEEDDSIAFIANMKSLKRLKFGWGKVGDFEPLSGHPSLEQLSSDSDILRWQRGLLRLPRLREFHQGNGMRNLDSGIRETLQERGIYSFEPAVIVC